MGDLNPTFFSPSHFKLIGFKADFSSLKKNTTKNTISCYKDLNEILKRLCSVNVFHEKKIKTQCLDFSAVPS